MPRELFLALGRRVRADTHGWLHNFYIMYFVGMIVSGLVGGAVIAGIDSIPYLDGFFIAVSALTCTGLASVPMSELTTGSFVVIALLALFGQSFMAMNIYPCLGRWFWSRRRANTLPGLKEKTVELAVWVMVSYFFLWHLFGILGLIGALRHRPWSDELRRRNFSREAQALHLTICAFANAGYTLTSDSIYDMRDNPLAYTIIALLIAAGCTLAPPFLRAYILALRWCRVHLWGVQDVAEYNELLDRGEAYSAYLFGRASTRYILCVNLAIMAAQFLLFCFSELVRQDALDAYGSPSVLVGMGFFQAVSTRFAGFQVMDLRLVSSGMVVTYTLFMYLPPTPGVDEYQDPEFKIVEADTSDGSDGDGDGESEADDVDVDDGNAAAAALKSVTYRVEHRISSESLKSEGPRETAGASSISVKRRGSSSSLEREVKLRGAVIKIGRGHKESRRASGRFTKSVVHDSILSWVSGYWGRVINVSKNHDLWLVFCLLILSFTEDKLIQEQPATFSIWYLFFEIISAYGNVGLSMGVPNKPYSLSGEFSKMGYLIIIFVMYLGKHRGMPALDASAIDFFRADAAAAAADRGKGKGKGEGEDRGSTAATAVATTATAVFEDLRGGGGGGADDRHVVLDVVPTSSPSRSGMHAVSPQSAQKESMRSNFDI